VIELLNIRKMQKYSIFVDRLFHKLLEHLLENCDLNVFLLNAHNWKLKKCPKLVLHCDAYLSIWFCSVCRSWYMAVVLLKC